MTQKKYFGTDGIRGCVGQYPIVPEFVLKLGWATGNVLSQKGHAKVLIGKDTRVSGYMFESALEAGLSAAGVDVHLLGPMPTPAVAYLTRTQRAQAGIVISASHNLYQDNGIKFFSGNGYKFDDAVELAIERELEKPMRTVNSDQLGKVLRFGDAPGRYIEFCKSTVAQEVTLQGLKIVVDCSNGATYHVAPSVFRELGATVIETAVKPDGFNINRDCGSTCIERCREKVLETQADLGIAFDGDGDRVLMVDHRGEIVDGDELLYILTRCRHEHGKFSGGIVGTLMSNLGLELALKSMKIPFVRTKVGDRYVLEAMLAKGWIYGGEQSGHLICLNHATTGDGIISALQVLAALVQSGKTLFDAKHGMLKCPQILLNVTVGTNTNILEDDAVIKAVKSAEKTLGDTGRVLLRMSGTEPLCRVMVEGESEATITKIAKQLVESVKASASV